jgi:hypothetical protein
MSDIALFFYVIISLATIWLGVKVYGQWVNHITIYSTVWGVQIVLFQMRLINYNDLSIEALVFIFGAWVVFIIASLTFRNFYRGSSFLNDERKQSHFSDSSLTIALVVLTLVGAVGTYQHWMLLIKTFGSVQNAIINGNIIYSLTRKGGIPGEWQYIDSASLSASFLGGYFIRMKRKFVILGVIPFITVFAESLTSFGRAKLILALVLWGVGFFVSKPQERNKIRKVMKNQVLILVSVALIFVLGVELVQVIRNASAKHSFAGESSTLSQTKGIAGLIGPSLYMYLSSDLAVLNKFLTYDFSGKIEHQETGANTLAPIYRILSRFDLTEYPPHYQPFYAVPVFTNTGTYLRELYADWGLFGTFIMVYLLGAICSVTYEVYHVNRSLIALAVLAHLYVIVFFSFAVQATRLGYWVSSLIFAIMAAVFANISSRRNETSNTRALIIER